MRVKDRRKQRERKIENLVETSAHSLSAALKLFRRAPETTTLTHYSRQMLHAIKDDYEFLMRVAKGQRIEE